MTSCHRLVFRLVHPLLALLFVCVLFVVCSSFLFFVVFLSVFCCWCCRVEVVFVGVWFSFSFLICVAVLPHAYVCFFMFFSLLLVLVAVAFALVCWFWLCLSWFCSAALGVWLVFLGCFLPVAAL